MMLSIFLSITCAWGVLRMMQHPALTSGPAVSSALGIWSNTATWAAVGGTLIGTIPSPYWVLFSPFAKPTLNPFLTFLLFLIQNCWLPQNLISRATCNHRIHPIHHIKFLVSIRCCCACCWYDNWLYGHGSCLGFCHVSNKLQRYVFIHVGAISYYSG